MNIGETSAVLDASHLKHRFIRPFVRRFFNDAHIVEDICQGTITRALEAEKKRQISTPDAFVFGVARNVVRSQIDAQSRSVLDLVDDYMHDNLHPNGDGYEILGNNAAVKVLPQLLTALG
jgi:DNA-directed RNA polymerase specialized sigma24 family protein